MVEVLGISTKTTELLQQVPRRSRRLARLPPTPLEIPMSHSGDQQPSLAAPVRTTGTWMHQMEPRPFSGKLGEDVEEWLTHYKRVSKYNGWNSTAQLDNVGLFLTDTALVWFENHEDSFTTWDSFVIDLTECFGDSTTKRKRAEQTLLQRAQVPGETCTTYIEAILKLCKTVNPRMSEEDKVGHLLKGIAEDVYNYLIGKESLASVADLIKHCRTFEALKLRRITPKFGRLANVTTVASVDDNDKCNFQFDLVATIRQIVREELERHPTGANVEQLRCACNQPQEHASAVSALSAMPGVADCRVDQLRQHRRSSPDDMTHDQRTRRATTTNRHRNVPGLTPRLTTSVEHRLCVTAVAPQDTLLVFVAGADRPQHMAHHQLGLILNKSVMTTAGRQTLILQTPQARHPGIPSVNIIDVVARQLQTAA